MTAKETTKEKANKEETAKAKEKQSSETEELSKQLEEAKKLAEERLNQLKYMQADFDNYCKKFDKEKEQIIKLADECLIKELIVILDDFDASLNIIENEQNKNGLEMLHKKFFQILERHGLKQVEALGKKFNPHFHEVLCKELSEHNEDEVIEELQKGYTLCSKVIRPSKVKVAKKIKKEEGKENLTKEKEENLNNEEDKER